MSTDSSFDDFESLSDSDDDYNKRLSVLSAWSFMDIDEDGQRQFTLQHSLRATSARGSLSSKRDSSNAMNSFPKRLSLISNAGGVRGGAHTMAESKNLDTHNLRRGTGEQNVAQASSSENNEAAAAQNEMNTLVRNETVLLPNPENSIVPHCLCSKPCALVLHRPAPSQLVADSQQVGLNYEVWVCASGSCLTWNIHKSSRKIWRKFSGELRDARRNSLYITPFRTNF